MPDLAELERRLAEATGPDEEIDWMLAGKPRFVVDGEPNFNVRRCTASLDAAIDLVEEKLPGCGISIDYYTEEIMDPPGWHVTLIRPGTLSIDDAEPEGESATAPVAALIALIRALREMEGADA